MKRLLPLLFMAVLFCACKNEDPKPDLTADLVGTYSHLFKYEYHDLQDETSWVISKTGENTVQLIYKIESKYIGTKPDSYSLEAPVEVLLEDIRITAAGKFVVDQVKEVLYGKKKAQTRIRILAQLKENDLDADMLFIDVESGNANDQQILMERK
jgi:hypothetical protein